jgi:hypothetical protein
MVPQWQLYPTPNESMYALSCWHAGRIYTGSLWTLGIGESEPTGILKPHFARSSLKVPIEGR